MVISGRKLNRNGNRFLTLEWMGMDMGMVFSRLRPSVVVAVAVCTECIVARRCVLEQMLVLLLTACRKGHIRNRLIPK